MNEVNTSSNQSKTQPKLSLLFTFLTGLFFSVCGFGQAAINGASTRTVNSRSKSEFTFEKTGNNGTRDVEMTETTAKANVPIAEIKVCSLAANFPNIPAEKIVIDNKERAVAVITIQDVVAGKPDDISICPTIDLRNFTPRIQKIQLITRAKRVLIKSVTIDATDTDFYKDIVEAGTPILTHFQTAVARLEQFTSIIGEPEQKHFTRLISTLKKVIGEISDSKGMVLPFTHESVRESARLILILADIVDEVYERYNRSPVHSPHIEYLRDFSQNIRKIFGWEDSLAGRSSRSIYALATGIQTYLRGDLYAAYSAVSSQDMTLINVNIQKIHNLMSANLSLGDAASSAQVRDFADAWNNSTFQISLDSISKAGKNDVTASAKPRLIKLLSEVAALRDLTGISFKIIDVSNESLK